jgi:hypothetical protein
VNWYIISTGRVGVLTRDVWPGAPTPLQLWGYFNPFLPSLIPSFCEVCMTAKRSRCFPLLGGAPHNWTDLGAIWAHTQGLGRSLRLLDRQMIEHLIWKRPSFFVLVDTQFDVQYLMSVRREHLVLLNFPAKTAPTNCRRLSTGSKFQTPMIRSALSFKIIGVRPQLINRHYGSTMLLWNLIWMELVIPLTLLVACL